PTQVYAMCNEMRRSYPDVRWWLHFHNTRGMALANILAGMQAGFTQYDSSFAGTGGCPFIPGATGNVASEDLAHMCEEMGVATGLDTAAVIAVGKLVQQRLGRPGNSCVLHAGRSRDLILN
ncbi:MAG: hydroxymethylglutaryl-CoA lyase, partial [Defluviitaleaceae bacterium]|nr:hydroxymethylglutaryl-CoA lyase [Defluviitaleaceae bacterium]